MNRPRVIVHLAVALDGATTGFQPDVERFYALAVGWQEDLTLAGADTILAQEPALADAPRPGPLTGGPVLAVVDSRRRVSAWTALRECGHWSDVVALRAESDDPPDGFPRTIRAGRGTVDLEAALELLGREGFRRARVDSGGRLAGALLQADLVDELSLLVHPVLAGPQERRWWGAAGFAGTLGLAGCEALPGDLVWLRYRMQPARNDEEPPRGAAHR